MTLTPHPYDCQSLIGSHRTPQQPLENCLFLLIMLWFLFYNSATSTFLSCCYGAIAFLFATCNYAVFLYWLQLPSYYPLLCLARLLISLVTAPLSCWSSHLCLCLLLLIGCQWLLVLQQSLSLTSMSRILNSNTWGKFDTGSNNCTLCKDFLDIWYCC